MKNAFILFLVINSSVLFGQKLPTGYFSKDDKRVARDKRIYGENYVSKKVYKTNSSYKQALSRVSFNEDNLKTTVLINDIENFILLGNWTLIGRKKNPIKSFIGHSYALKHQNDFIFEYSKIDFSKEAERGSDYFLKIVKDIENLSSKNVGEFKLTKTDVENNYRMYKKTEFNLKTNSLSDVYFLIGLKNNTLFQMALSNFLEQDYLDMDTLFIQTYLDNQ
ncbi:MAG: hypothetical protein ACI9XR_000752 [Flavobacterium sp.]|jgi:hypothetical protein